MVITSDMYSLAAYRSSMQADEQEEPADELMENTDPELALRRKLIETMFGTSKDPDRAKKTRGAGVPDDQPQPDTDIVEISPEALEMSRRRQAEARGNTRNGADVEIRLERREITVVELSSSGQQTAQAEPLVIDFNGNGIGLSDVREGAGVVFDLTGDGSVERVSWVLPEDGFLAYDRNGNGRVDSGRELFGDQHGAANGFEELAKFDTNRDNVIDSCDDIYNDLWVWRDVNFNGLSERGELSELGDAGIRAVSLIADSTREYIAGNYVAGYASYDGGGTTGRVGEVFLNYLL